MAELERNVIRERVISGLEYARLRGTKSGKPIGRPRRVFKREELLRMRKGGASIQTIAQKLGLGVGTVARALQDGASSPRRSKTPSK